MRSAPTSAAVTVLAGLVLLGGAGAGCTVAHRLDPVAIEPTVSPSRTAADRVRALCVAMVGPSAGALEIAIVAGDAPRATSSAGTLTVTWELLETLPEPQIAAAIAHELGHRIRAGDLALPDPSGSAPAIDPDPDRTAIRLLQAAGYSEDALSQLLARLIEDPAMPPATRQSLLLRFGRLVGS